LEGGRNLVALEMIMQRIRAAEVAAPVYIGDVILPEVYGTDIVATKDIL